MKLEWVWCKGSWHGRPMRWKQGPSPQAPPRRNAMRCGKFKQRWCWGCGLGTGWQNSEWRAFGSPEVLVPALLSSFSPSNCSALINAVISLGEMRTQNQRT